MEYTHKNKGTCSTKTIVELDGDVIKSVKIMNGCDGNLKGICALVQGMKADDVIARFRGIRCGFKSTSCPDQLAQALMEAKAARQ